MDTNWIEILHAAHIPVNQYCTLEDTFSGRPFKYLIFIASARDKEQICRTALLEVLEGSHAYWYWLDKYSTELRKSPGLWILAGIEPKNDLAAKDHVVELQYFPLTASQLIKLSKGLSINHVYT